MNENRIDERIEARADSPPRRFTVHGFNRVQGMYLPTLVIGAIVVIAATVIFMITMLGK